MNKYVLGLALLLVLSLGFTCGSDDDDDGTVEPRTAGPLGTESVLGEPWRLAELRAGLHGRQVSSYDRTGGNADFGMMNNENRLFSQASG